MNANQHTLLARALIDACGGVDACCKPVTRVERTQLYAYRDFNSGVFMPADVIETLESRCGNPVYSSFLFHARGDGTPVEQLEAVAYQLGEGGMELQRAIRIACADGELSETERRDLEALFLQQEERLRNGRSAMNAGPSK